MDKYDIDHCLERLRKDGEALGEKASDEDRKVWLATATGTLALFLPDGSPIMKAIAEIRDSTGQASKQDARWVVTDAVRLLKVAAEFNRMRRDDQTVATLRDDLRAVMGETFLKSPWFYLAIAILTAAFGLAVLGVIQIKSYKLDAEQELKNAKAKIEDQVRSVEQTISTLGQRAQESAAAAKQAVEKKLDDQLASDLANAKQRINEGATQHLETLKQTKAPALESGLVTLQERSTAIEQGLKGLQQDILSLKKRADELTDDLHRMEAAAQTGGLVKLSIFLNRSRYFVLLEVVVAGLALLSSFIVLVAAFRRR